MKMNNNIDDSLVFLEESTHTYSLKDNQDVEFTSVTTYVSEFFEKFDQLKIAKKLINTNIKYAHRTVEDIISDWDKARDYGTFVHKQIEDQLTGVSEATDLRAQYAVKWLNEFLNNRNHDLYAEKIIFSKELQIAGTMDILIRLKDSNEYVIIDWKTNKKLSKKSFNHKMGTHPLTSNIEDCKYNVYAFQLSLYRYILEEYYGIKIKQQIIAHIDDYRVNAYLPPYYKGHMEAISNLRKDSF